MDIDISVISLKINELFDKLFLQRLARSTGFIERSSSRLSGHSFAMLNLMHCHNVAQISLQDMCDTLETGYGVKISKQSLDERFNTYAVAYFKSMYEHTVKELTNSTSDWTNNCKFSHISIMDCMGFKLPDRLATFYPGSGTKSSIKIGYDFDVLRQSFRDLAIKPGNENDATFLSDLEPNIQANGLYIKDLGFYKRAHFVKIDKAGAFFLSRCKSSATFYVIGPKGRAERIALYDLINGVNSRVEKMVYMDKECRVAARLILEPVGEEVAQKRRAKARHKTKSNGYKVSERTLDACGYTILVTNAPQSMLPAYIAIEVYFLRWQIEIIFKTWKSLLCIDKLKPMSIFRFESYLYCKLIHVVISMLLGNLAQARLGMAEEISVWKATKLYVKKIGKIEKILGKGLKALETFLKNLVLKISKKGLKSAKKLGHQLYKRRPNEVIKCISYP